VKQFNLSYKELMIIGNGFDLNHGLKTTYSDFVAANKNSKVLKKFEEEAQKYIETWYDFESAIQCMQQTEWENFCSSATESFDVALSQFEERTIKNNDLFEEIRQLFLSYIANINQTNRIELSPILVELFTPNSIAFTFNYTSFIEEYTSNVYYVHGSIERDKEIILGMANDEISDISSSESRYFCKSNFREYLNFKRFLGTIDYPLQEKMNLLNEFKKHVQTLDTGKGGYDIPATINDNGYDYDLSEIPDPIVQYGRKYKFSSHYLNEDFSFLYEINTLYVIGHGLESDVMYLESLFKNLKNLKNVFLLIFIGEEKRKDNKISYKKNMLKKWFPNIKIQTMMY
jgi:hypothetical protein